MKAEPSGRGGRGLFGAKDGRPREEDKERVRCGDGSGTTGASVSRSSGARGVCEVAVLLGAAASRTTLLDVGVGDVCGAACSGGCARACSATEDRWDNMLRRPPHSSNESSTDKASSGQGDESASKVTSTRGSRGTESTSPRSACEASGGWLSRGGSTGGRAGTTGTAPTRETDGGLAEDGGVGTRLPGVGSSPA